MKLAKKLKKTMGFVLISTMILSAVPTMAADYDNHWAKEAITKWSDYEVVSGYGDGVFKPKQEVKRSELAAFIVRVFGLESTEGAAKFSDVSADAWYAQDVARISAAGIMQGAAGKFNPNGFATREEVAVTLVNAFKLTGSGDMNFKDQAEISAWAKKAVATLVAKDYAKGQVGNLFAPKANITRAEVVQLLDNIVKELIHKPGTYTNSVEGNVVVNTKDTVLDGMTISGDVYLAQGIGLGDATLKNTQVAGQVIVSGGGVNSIHFENASVSGGVMVGTKSPVRLVSKDSSLQVTAQQGQSLVLTGNFQEVVVPAGVVLELKEAKVEKITVQETTNTEGAVETVAAAITMDKASTVTELTAQSATDVKGEGQITTLKVESNQVTTTMKPEQTEVKPGFDVPVVVEDTNKKPVITPGGGGGGGDSVEADATIKSVALNGNTASQFSISDHTITLKVADMAQLPEAITNFTFTVGNVAAGSTLNTKINLGSSNQQTINSKVEAGGKVTYQVTDLAKSLDKLFEEMDRTVGEDLLPNGTISTNTALTKVQSVFSYFDNSNTSSEALAVMKEMLAKCGVSVSSDYTSISVDMTVGTNTSNQTTYTLVIKK